MVLEESGVINVSGGYQDYSSRLASLLQADDSKIALIKDLLEDCVRQSQKISKLELQLEDERETKEKWRGRYLEIAKETERATQNPYVAVLIDGDGMIFTEPYLLHSHGGQNAATELLQVTRNTLRTSGLFGATEPFEIVVRVFANVSGVAEALRCRGIPTVFRQFAVGFSQPRALVDFIDVGRGKEMADAKIAGEIRFHLSNHNCKQVILGVSHDNGYARILSSILADGEDHNRISLVEGVPFGKEFNSLPFSRIIWSDLFLSKKVDAWVPDFVQRQQKQHQRQGADWGKARAGGRDATGSQFEFHPTPESAHGPNLPPPPPYENISTSERKRGKTHPPPIPRPPLALLHRVYGYSLCWNHYLGLGCPSSDRCGHSHVRVLNVDEMTGLRFIAQGFRCQLGIECKNPICYYGHRCQVVGVCNGNCGFTPEEHEEGKYKPALAGQQAHPKGSAAGRPASPCSTASGNPGGAPGAGLRGSGGTPIPPGNVPKGPKKKKAKKPEPGPTQAEPACADAL